MEPKMNFKNPKWISTSVCEAFVGKPFQFHRPQENQSQPLLQQGDGSTGDCSDSSDVAALVQQINRLKIANDALTVERDALNVELMNLKASQTADETQDPGPLAPEPTMTDEAARKRLERMCKKKTDGTLSHQSLSD